MARKLTHLTADGTSRMVNVSAKKATHRVAVTEAEIRMKPSTFETLISGGTVKGNALEVARIAGIAAAKQTAHLIPLCHPVSISKASVEFAFRPPDTIAILARAEAVDRTGVEMEALSVAAVAALTIYDMCKAIDRGMEIRSIRLLEKRGGKSGRYVRRKHRGRRPGRD